MAGDVQATIRALVEESADQGQLRAELDGLLEEHPDARWEVLDILDAYYRSGRLNDDLIELRAGLERDIYGDDQDRTQIMPRHKLSRSTRALAEAKLNDRMTSRRWDTEGRPETEESGVASKPAGPTITNAGTTRAQSRKRRKRARKRKSAAIRAVPATPQEPATPESASEESDTNVITVRGLRRLRPGTVLKDRFVAMSPLGRGGMGVVFKALDRQREGVHTRTPYVALKVLREEFKDHPDWLALLQRETQNAQSLAHPNVVNVFDFDRDGDICFMTMELLEGESLSTIFSKTQPKTFPMHECVKVIEGMGQGLAYAHSKDIAHCDFKPGNVFVTADGAVKILDFGIAHVLRQPDVAEAISDSPKAVTPAYSSCEALEGGAPDARDDVYSLGVVAYELLAGRHPFDRKSALDARHLRLEPEPIPGLNRRQWRALKNTLALNREDRTDNVLDFLAAFRPVGKAPGFDQRVDRSARLVNRGNASRRWLGSGLLLAATVGAAAFLIISLTPGFGPDDNWLDEKAGLETANRAPALPAKRDIRPAIAITPPSVQADTPGTAADAIANELPAETRPVPAPEIVAVELGSRDRAVGMTGKTEPAGGIDDAPDRKTVAGAASGVAVAPQASGAAGSAGAPTQQSGIETPATATFAGFRIDRQTYLVSEASLAVTVSVRRADGAGEAAFIWHTEDGTATAGEDYAGFDYVTEWLAQGEASRDVFIPIMSDTLVEGDRTFTLVIEPMLDDGTLGTPLRANVIIRDDD